MAMRRLAKWHVRTAALTAALVVVPGVLAASSAEATSSSNPSYSGCLGAGILHKLTQDPTAPKNCRSSDHRVTWNQTGPQGPQGAQGPQGSRGAQGSPGSQGTQGSQ